MKNNLSRKTYFEFFRKKRIFDQKAHFSEISPKLDCNPKTHRFTEKKKQNNNVKKKMILKTKVKIDTHIVVPSTHVFYYGQI